ncbi:MAG: 6-phosphofructokinase, partial [Bacilli bacterium]|nr:6-phosphofructokinase [Bacilli bacterium]
MTKIAILTSGGDAPGMNAAIRAVVRSALVEGFETYVVYDGYKGLYEGKIKQVERYFVSEIINRGGTIIGTARLPQFVNLDVQETSANNLKKLGIKNLVVIGGDGSYRGALALSKFGIKCVCLPGTIDNDLSSTDFTIGFDTALNTIIEAVDKLRDTSSSHQRCSIIEVMGRNCGDLALYSGIAAGAELILSSERVMTKEMILSELIQAKSEGKRHEIVIVSEKLFDVNKLAEEIEQKVGMEARATILGHLQRGGKPSAFDRVLASRMGSRAVEAFESCYSSCCIGIKNNQVVVMDLETSLKMPRMVDLRLYTDS